MEFKLKNIKQEKMRTTLLLLISLVLIGGCIQKSEVQRSFDFSLITSDSVHIFGDEYIQNNDAATILLFHQGGSNTRGEYAPIIPRLVAEGFNVVTIDQRQGGQTYGSYNRTVQQFELNEFSYCDAYEDLVSTLGYVLSNENLKGKIVVWGSSYSGSLAIQLAARNQDKVSAVLSFSPASGGPMAPCKPDEYFKQLKIPLLVLRPLAEMEIESVKQQFNLLGSYGHQTFVAEPGVHGSSMLVSDRVGADVQESWDTVINFINSAINED